MANQRSQAPVRIAATIVAMVLVAAAAVWLLVQIYQVLVWLVIAGFFAVVLNPIAGALERRAHMPRPVAALAALLVVVAVIAGVVTLLVRPLVEAGRQFVRQLPDYILQAQTGQGPIGGLLRRFNVLDLIQQNQQRIQQAIQQLGDPALNAVLTAGTVVVGIVVVLVLTFLLVLDGPRLVEAAVGLLPEGHRERARRVAHDASRAVTGYVGGQLLIALLCGGSTFVVLYILGVPFRSVVALFVGLVDLIPVVGATIGGLLAVGVSFLHSVQAGIIMLVFFLVYQQLENHLLQPFIQSRTVKLSALAVLISVLVGVELAGIIGALLAIPAAGIIQVVVRDLWHNRRGKAAAEEADALQDTSPPEDRVPSGPGSRDGEPAGQQLGSVPDGSVGKRSRAGGLGQDPEDDVYAQPGQEAGKDGHSEDPPGSVGVDAEPAPQVRGERGTGSAGNERGELEPEERQERDRRPDNPRDVPQ